MHPKQDEIDQRKLANQKRREERAALAQRQKEATARAIAMHRLRFVHIRRDKHYPSHVATDGANMHPRGGITVAYSLPERRGDRMVAVTCAVCHDTDAYCKAAGRFVAALHFSMGSHIGARVPKNVPPSFFFKQMFSNML